MNRMVLFCVLVLASQSPASAEDPPTQLRRHVAKLQFLPATEAVLLLRDLRPGMPCEVGQNRITFHCPPTAHAAVSALLEQADRPADHVQTRFVELRTITAKQAAATVQALLKDYPTLNILPDVRTNRVFLMGQQVHLMRAEALLHALDRPEAEA